MTDVDDTDSDGTCADTIFRELCMIRSSTCSRQSKDNFSQYEPVYINSIYPSESTLFDNSKNTATGEKWSTDWSSILHNHNRPAEPLFFPNESLKNESNTAINTTEYDCTWLRYNNYVPCLNVPFSSHFSNSYWSRNLLSETCSRITPLVNTATSTVNSRGTNTPHFDFSNFRWIKTPKCTDKYPWEKKRLRSLSESNSDDSSSVEYLVRDRCSSPDCACDKQFQSKVLSYKPRYKLYNRRTRPRSVCSQVTETSLGLKLGDFEGQIVIQEKGLNRIMDSARSKKRHGIDSKRSVPNVIRHCQDSSVSSENSSESAITFLKKCSDCNILSTLGLKRDQGVTSEIGGSSILNEISDSKGSKSQMVETYGKLLSKIEKLKKITSWKSKRRKNKLKYTLEGTACQLDHREPVCYISENDHECHHLEDKNNYEDTKFNLSSGDSTAVLSKAKMESKIGQDKGLIEVESSKENESLEKQMVMTCEVGIQSVQSESFMTTIGSSVDNAQQMRVQKRIVHQETVDSTTSTNHLDKCIAECVKKKKESEMVDRVEKVKTKKTRPDSLHTINTSNSVQGMDDSGFNWGGRETQEEILDHLREINRLIERESCASNSTHRLCKSERNLGYGANKSDSLRRIKKIDKEKEDIPKNNKKEGRVYWAVTKVTVYPDSCRTYEVMRLSKRRPQNVPSTSETVFVLLPNKS